MPSNRSGAVFAAIALVIVSVTAWTLMNGGYESAATDAAARLAQAYQSGSLVR